MTQMPDFPGPNNGILGLATAFEFQKDPLAFLQHIVHDYPEDIIHWKFGPQFDVYLVTHPEYVHELLVKQWRKLKKMERIAKVIGKISGPKNLLIAEGDEWKKLRKMTAPAFHTQRIRNYIELMERHTLALISEWEDDSVVDLDNETTIVSMGIIGEILFGIRDIEKDASELSNALKVMMDMFMFEATSLLPVPDWVPTPRNLKENRAMKLSSEYILDIIHQRRASSEDTGDVLSALLHVVDEDDGATFTDNEVLDQLQILFNAGYETTSTLLTWAMYLLAKHPDIQEELYQEVASVMKSGTPDLADIDAMTYTDRVLQETMRLYPPAWNLVVRQVTEELTLADHVFPPGAIFFISPWVIHHDPRYWEEPQTFKPERFEGNWKDRVAPHSFIPFGGGPRVCIGSHLAEMEAEVILATLVKNFKFALENQLGEVEIKSTISIRPKDGMKLRVKKR